MLYQALLLFSNKSIETIERRSRVQEVQPAQNYVDSFNLYDRKEKV